MMNLSRSAALFFAVCLGLSSPLFAQLPAVPPPGPPAAARIGIVAGVSGAVEIESSGVAGHVAGSGDPVFIGDRISTDASGHLQILLLDETVFTIGPGTTLVIDKFVYNPANDDGRVSATVMKGVFRFISGRIAKKKPSNVEITLPTGSVGVRGTIFYGRVEGNSSTILLLGPGEKNNTGQKAGRILVQNEVNGKTVAREISKSGYGSRIEGTGIPPTPPVQFSDREIEEMTSPLLPAARQETKEEKQGSQTAASASAPAASGTAASVPPDGGTTTALSDERSATELSGGSPSSLLSNPLLIPPEIKNPDDSVTTQASQEAVKDLTKVQDGITMLDQLRTLTMGTAHYEALGADLKYSGTKVGTYDFKMDIDFAGKTVGGGNSAVVVNASPVAASSVIFNLPVKDYAASSGPGVFNFGISPVSNCSTCTGNLNVVLNNKDGVIGKTAQDNLTLVKSSAVFSGSSTASRSDGNS